MIHGRRVFNVPLHLSGDSEETLTPTATPILLFVGGTNLHSFKLYNGSAPPVRKYRMKAGDTRERVVVMEMEESISARQLDMKQPGLDWLSLFLLSVLASSCCEPVRSGDKFFFSFFFLFFLTYFLSLKHSDRDPKTSES